MSAAAAGAPASTAPRLPPELQAEVDRYKSIQAELNKLIGKQTQLGAQMNENVVVKEELNKVEEGQKVYKLVGPVLALQDADEAKTDVQRRIDFIRAELERVEAAVTDHQKSLEEIRAKLEAARAPAA